MPGYNRLPCRVRYEPAMTFAEIGEIMGLNKNNVQLIYAKGMNKLCSLKVSEFREMRELLAFRETIHPQPSILDCDEE